MKGIENVGRGNFDFGQVAPLRTASLRRCHSSSQGWRRGVGYLQKNRRVSAKALRWAYACNVHQQRRSQGRKRKTKRIVFWKPSAKTYSYVWKRETLAVPVLSRIKGFEDKNGHWTWKCGDSEDGEQSSFGGKIVLLNSGLVACCSRIQYWETQCWIEGKITLLRKGTILGRRWTCVPKKQLPIVNIVPIVNRGQGILKRCFRGV